ncbi:unnamed protein product [Urochloa humidicola]
MWDPPVSLGGVVCQKKIFRLLSGIVAASDSASSSLDLSPVARPSPTSGAASRRSYPLRDGIEILADSESIPCSCPESFAGSLITGDE